MVDDENLRFAEMRKAEVLPDLITFSILIKSNCDAGKVDVSLRLLDELLVVFGGP